MVKFPLHLEGSEKSFTVEVEQELCGRMPGYRCKIWWTDMEIDVESADLNSLRHRLNKEKKLAGNDWARDRWKWRGLAVCAWEQCSMGRINGCIEHSARNVLRIEEIAVKKKKNWTTQKMLYGWTRAVQSTKSNMFKGKEVGFRGSYCRKRKNIYSSWLLQFHWILCSTGLGFSTWQDETWAISWCPNRNLAFNFRIRVY